MNRISASLPKPAHLAGEGDMGIEAAQQALATREFNMGSCRREN